MHPNSPNTYPPTLPLTVTSLMLDYVEGAMEDVKKDFVKTLVATKKKEDPAAFYDTTVQPVRSPSPTHPPTHLFPTHPFPHTARRPWPSSAVLTHPPTQQQCAEKLINRLGKHTDKRADAFELYVTRNIFKVAEEGKKKKKEVGGWVGGWVGGLGRGE